MIELLKEIDSTYQSIFGKTPLKQRLDDIFKEATELHRFSDIKNLKEETGDILTSVLQLVNEAEWNVEELIHANLNKVRRRTQQYKSLGRKVNVAILGGAFDPVTQGHICLAKFVLNTSKHIDEVWLMPCYSHLYGKKMEDSVHRLKMCELAAQNDGRIKAFDYEISNQMSGETYHLIKKLLDEDFAKDRYDFSMIIGMDNANTFKKWVNYQHLEKLISFIVVHRLGIERDSSENWYFNKPHMYLAEEQSSGMMNISSTEVRNMLNKLHQNKNIFYTLEKLGKVLPAGVLEYIIDQKLYEVKP